MPRLPLEEWEVLALRRDLQRAYRSREVPAWWEPVDGEEDAFRPGEGHDYYNTGSIEGAE